MDVELTCHLQAPDLHVNLDEASDGRQNVMQSCHEMRKGGNLIPELKVKGQSVASCEGGSVVKRRVRL